LEFYSATKKNEIFPFTGKWIELDNIILIEGKPGSEGQKSCSLSFVEYRPNTNAVIL
jgi:hypothetical protein